jgi:hypothetical protein
VAASALSQSSIFAADLFVRIDVFEESAKAHSHRKRYCDQNCHPDLTPSNRRLHGAVRRAGLRGYRRAR